MQTIANIDIILFFSKLFKRHSLFFYIGEIINLNMSNEIIPTDNKNLINPKTHNSRWFSKCFLLFLYFHVVIKLHERAHFSEPWRPAACRAPRRLSAWCPCPSAAKCSSSCPCRWWRRSTIGLRTHDRDCRERGQCRTSRDDARG